MNNVNSVNNSPKFIYECDRVEYQNIDKVLKTRSDAGWRLVAVATAPKSTNDHDPAVYRHWWEKVVDE